MIEIHFDSWEHETDRRFGFILAVGRLEQTNGQDLFEW
jgi:hypothetical protein